MPVRADTPSAPARPADGGPSGRPGLHRSPVGGPVGVVLAALLIAVVAGSLTVALRPAAATGRPSAAAAAPGVAAPAAVAPSTAPVVAVRATTLDIPALGIVASALVDLDVDASGVLVPPSTTAVAGWFRGSAVPGEVGPTVVAGHVDSYRGPGIFFHLDAMKPGDLVTIGRSDGRSVRFRVTDVLIVAKTQFPTVRVYGPTPGAELRLITCGGEFDHSARRYLRNVVVSGVLDADYPGSP